MATNTPGFFWVPEAEELVEGPFDALDALLLGCKCLCIEPRPVGEGVEIEKTEIGQEGLDVAGMRSAR